MNDSVINNALMQYGTPCYIYDKTIIEQSIIQLKEVMKGRIELLYSVKANPLFGICKIMIENGLGLEVSSIGELHLALQTGLDPQKIVYSGPGKTAEDIQYAVEHHIGMISVESIDEFYLINRIASKMNIVQSVLIRINPKKRGKNSKISMSGISSQFGIDEEILDDLLADDKYILDNVNLNGIHIYFGTQNLDANSIANNAEYIINIAQQLEKKYNICLKYINLGGGFGVNYFPTDTFLDLELLGRELSVVLNKYEYFLQEKKLLMESGRFLTANSGVFITKVLYKKSSKGNKFLVCDGGSNFHAASAFLGRFIRNNYPMYVLGKDDIEKEKYTIVGPLCTPTDILGLGYELPCSIKEGDYIIIEKSGAYGLTNSPYKFLSFNVPWELLIVENGKIHCMRSKGDSSDVMYGQNIN